MLEAMVVEMVALGLLEERHSGRFRRRTGYARTRFGRDVLAAALAQEEVLLAAS